MTEEWLIRRLVMHADCPRCGREVVFALRPPLSVRRGELTYEEVVARAGALVSENRRLREYIQAMLDSRRVR